MIRNRKRVRLANSNRGAKAFGVIVLAAACAGLPLARAAGPLNQPVPLQAATPNRSSAEAAASLAAAQRAQELGLPTVAIGLYEQLLAQPGADRAALTLPLATALLDAGRAAEAEKVLNELSSPRGPDWRLRLALAYAQQRNFGAARSERDQINVDQLNRPDRQWFWFLQGVLADTATPRDRSTANDFYRKDEQEAPSDLARATIREAGLRARLTLVPYSAADVKAARDAYDQNRDNPGEAYRYAEDYAVALDGTGRQAEAVKFLTDILGRMPRAQRTWADELRRLLGMIGERGRGGAGRTALTQLLETGAAPDLQRQALQILAQDSQREPERGLFRAELDRLIGASPKSAILDDILLMRSELALGDTPKDYATAERRAAELKDNFPTSPLRAHAFVVLATSAWEQRRYRLAADNARQARETLAASPAATSPTEARVVGQTVAELRVMEAEARFRAEDYRLAADAYSAVLRDPPAGITPGDLIFQRALAEIRADTDDPTKDLTMVIDDLEADSRFDPANRWEAEWSLARALRIQGKTEVALERVTRLLQSADAASASISPDLRARMAWLQARLSFEADHPDQTLQLVTKLDGATVGVDPNLRTEIASTAALLEVQAEYALGRDANAARTLNKLRADFASTDAAIDSYLVEADHYVRLGPDKIHAAQAALQSLIENPRYKASEYVPYALFELALLSERLGTENDLREADKLIEKLVDKDRVPPAKPELVFAARLKQGDLLRTLNDFPSAQRAYEDLVNNPRYAQQSQVVLAQLRLAECLNAQSSTDPSGQDLDRAQAMFEELLYRVSAPEDVRVEAGYNLGRLLVRRGQLEKARDVWWRDVITPFLMDGKRPLPRGATRPYWLARTLLDLGDLLEQRQNVDEAVRVYVLLRDSRLGYGGEMALERLQRLGVPPPGKP